MQHIPTGPLATLAPANSIRSATELTAQNGGTPMDFMMLLTQTLIGGEAPDATLPESTATVEQLLGELDLEANPAAGALIAPTLVPVQPEEAPVTSLPVTGKPLPLGDLASEEVQPQLQALARPAIAPSLALNTAPEIKQALPIEQAAIGPQALNAETVPLLQTVLRGNSGASGPVLLDQPVFAANIESGPLNQISVAAFTPPTSTSAAPTGSTSQQPVFDLPQQVGNSQWGQALGQRLNFMAENGINRAEIRLHPAHLGPMEVQISVSNDKVSVLFHADNAATREAIESAMPRLREMIGETGMSLSQSNVGTQQQGQNQNGAPTADTNEQEGGDQTLAEETGGAEGAIDGNIEGVESDVLLRSLVDAYA